jgi:dethiobiotin synthetase
MSIPAGVFVTGTDTGVGKTLASAALAACWRQAGRTPVYVKPVQSGAADGDDDAADVGALADVPTVVGAVLGDSLAPAVAARRGGDTLTIDELTAVVADAAEAHPGSPLIVEGAGGLLVELGTDGTTCADLAVRLGLPVVVVVRPGLGTLNHTALTLSELRRHRLALAGVVVCGFPEDPDLATATNLAELDRWSEGRLAGVIPHLPRLSRAALDDAPTWFGSDLGGRAEIEDLLAAGTQGGGA